MMIIFLVHFGKGGGGGVVVVGNRKLKQDGSCIKVHTKGTITVTFESNSLQSFSSMKLPPQDIFCVNTGHFREFVCIFCFDLCKTSQTVIILKLLTRGKFTVSKLLLWMQSGRSFFLC